MRFLTMNLTKVTVSMLQMKENKYQMNWQYLTKIGLNQPVSQYVPTTVAVAVVVSGFILGNFRFFATLGSHVPTMRIPYILLSAVV